MLTGSLRDMCTEGILDPNNGSYTFNSIDMTYFEPGTYTMQITGKSGLKQNSFTVDFVLVDPCFTVDLRLKPLSATPFSAIDFTYVLRDDGWGIPYSYNQLIDPATLVDCGPAEVEFFQHPTNEILDP